MRDADVEVLHLSLSDRFRMTAGVHVTRKCAACCHPEAIRRGWAKDLNFALRSTPLKLRFLQLCRSLFVVHFVDAPAKMFFGIIMWTPLLPSTSSVMCRSAATLESM